eukprot:TRINITY_DN27836_c0_g1_i1.p1 TRINITY_DN27836_c0_g1~~TRINITY_DN27836_c0_g1_i1.p1  ORF type:complete len:231 (+),score=14.49 TRINITY_DN27836_c0_g1_i1:167-859(+)
MACVDEEQPEVGTSISRKLNLSGELSASVGRVTSEVTASAGRVTGDVSASLGKATGEASASVGRVTGEVSASAGRVAERVEERVDRFSHDLSQLELGWQHQTELGWLLYAAGWGSMCCCGFAPIAILLWCAVGVIFYRKGDPPRLNLTRLSFRSAYQEEKFVAHLSVCSACFTIVATVCFILVLVVMFPAEGDECLPSATLCKTEAELDEDGSSCECWDNRYGGRRRGSR